MNISPFTKITNINFSITRTLIFSFRLAIVFALFSHSVLAGESFHLKTKAPEMIPSSFEIRSSNSDSYKKNINPIITSASLSIFVAEKERRLRSFWGFNLFTMWKRKNLDSTFEDTTRLTGIGGNAGFIIGHKYALYLNSNIFFAATWCDANTSRVECEKNSAKMLGISPEAGLRFSLTKHYYISLYRRFNYSLGDINNFNSVGMGLGYQ